MRTLVLSLYCKLLLTSCNARGICAQWGKVCSRTIGILPCSTDLVWSNCSKSNFFVQARIQSVYLTYTFWISISINIDLVKINSFFSIIVQNILNIWRIIYYIKDRNLSIWLNYINIRICDPDKTNLLAYRYLSYMLIIKKKTSA